MMSAASVKWIAAGRRVWMSWVSSALVLIGTQTCVTAGWAWRTAALPLGLLPAQVHAADEHEVVDWKVLGPSGPSSTDSIAVSPDGRVIVASQSGRIHGGARQRMIRTVNAGDSWEVIGQDDGRRVLTFHSSPSAQVLYAVRREVAPATRTLLERSFDHGDTWESALAIEPHAGGTGFVSIQLPLIANAGGPSFIGINNRLFRADKVDSAWTEVDLPNEQQVHVVTPSPAYPMDGLVYGVFVRSSFWCKSCGRPAPEESLRAHDRSLGVVYSSDGGAVWQATPAQPEIDGVPYRNVRALAISPTFALDRTLFAFAWGPRTQKQNGDPTRSHLLRYEMPSALFRSRDAGSSWEVIEQNAPDERDYHASIALSPKFSDDGLVLMTRSTDSSINECRLSRSTDSGSTWTEVWKRSGKSLGCVRPYLITQDGQARAFTKGNWFEEWSEDGGLTWGRPSLASTGIESLGEGLAVVPADGLEATVYVGGVRGGLVARGQGARVARGQAHCAIPVGAEHARSILTQFPASNPLGCPLEPPWPVRVRERPSIDRVEGKSVDYWVEGQGAEWYETHNGVAWVPRPKLLGNWDPDTFMSMDGSIQQFDGGIVLTMSRPEVGTRGLILVNIGPAFIFDLP